MAALGKTARYYRDNPDAKARRLKQQSIYESSPEQRKYRSQLSVIRHKRKLTGNAKDLSHQKDGSIVLEDRTLNRKRNGANGLSTKK